MKGIQAAYRGSCDALRLVDISPPRPRVGQAVGGLVTLTEGAFPVC